MPLTFTSRHWHDDATGTVTFPAWSGSVRVPCRITDEALKSMFAAGSSDEDLVKAFAEHRAAIEGAASMKFELAKDPLRVVLVSTDFESKIPAKPEPKTLTEAEIVEKMDRFRRVFHRTTSTSAAAIAAAVTEEVAGEATAIGTRQTAAGETSPSDAAPTEQPKEAVGNG